MIGQTNSENSDPPRQRVQWGELCHGFRLSLAIPQILIAACAVLVLSFGQWGIAQLPFAPASASELWESPGSQIFPSGQFQSGQSPTGWRVAAEVPAVAFHWLLRPIQTVYRPLATLLSTGNDWSSAAYAWTQLFWALGVWALFGGAITRIAAVHYAGNQSVGIRDALKFSGEKFLSLFTAPLVPGGALLLLWMLFLVTGWVGMIPVIGPVLIGLFYFIGLLMAFVMALVVVGIFASWPLMIATISTEGSDAFDGFSRSFSYLFSRPREWFGLSIASALYGVISITLAIGMSLLVVHFANWGLASGMGDDAVSSLNGSSPFLQTTASATTVSENDAVPLSAVLTGFWLQTFVIILQGIAVSLFWSLSTLTYFVLRLSDDGTPLTEVFLEEPLADDSLPLVGTAASEQPVVERPIAPASEQTAATNETATEKTPDEKN